jgi:hypothetical protein
MPAMPAQDGVRPAPSATTARRAAVNAATYLDGAPAPAAMPVEGAFAPVASSETASRRAAVDASTHLDGAPAPAAAATPIEGAFAPVSSSVTAERRAVVDASTHLPAMPLVAGADAPVMADMELVAPAPQIVPAAEVPAATPVALGAALDAPPTTPPAQRVVSARAIAAQRAAAALPQGYAPTSAEAGAQRMLAGARAWRTDRASAPRLAGVYGASAAPAALRAGDPLGLARHGGFEAAHAPTRVVPRYAALGMDRDVAPVVDRLTSRGGAGARLDAVAARQLRPIVGDVSHLSIETGPAAAEAAAALQTPGFAAGNRVYLGAGVAPTSSEGLQVIAHEARHAQSPRRPVHRFIDKLDMPGEAAARQAGDRAARVAAPAPGGVVFGLVPRSVRGTFADRFALDGWSKGDMRSSAGGLDAGVALREARRSLDLNVEHDFIRFPGEITQVPAAAIPVDLTSQLSGRADPIQARTAVEGKSMGLVFEPREVEVPLKALFWGRRGGDRVARGPVETRQLELRGRLTAIDPKSVEGVLEVEGKDAPVGYKLARRDAPRSADAAATPAAKGPRALRQTEGVVRGDSKDVRIGGSFSEKSTSVHAEGSIGADLIQSPAFKKAISPAAEVLPKNADFLQASGLDLGSAEATIESNRETADRARSSYVRRGGLPNPAEWAFTVGAESEAPAQQQALALQFKRSSGPEAQAIEPDSALGRRIRQTRGTPLSSPVLDFMEKFFHRDLRGVRVSEGAEARQLNRELGSEAFAASTPAAAAKPGADVYVTTPVVAGDKPAAAAERMAAIGHELSHVIDAQSAPAAEAAPRPAPMRAPSAPSRLRAAARPAPRPSSASGEARAREAERQILAIVRKDPQQRNAPSLPMTHTSVTDGDRHAAKAAEVAAEKAPIQKKKAGDTPIQGFEKTGSLVPKPWEALFPRPPKRDLTPLVYQIWNKIKRDLSVEMERRSGGF